MASITSPGFKSEAYTINLKEHLKKNVKHKIFYFQSNTKYTGINRSQNHNHRPEFIMQLDMDSRGI